MRNANVDSRRKTNGQIAMKKKIETKKENGISKANAFDETLKDFLQHLFVRMPVHCRPF